MFLLLLLRGHASSSDSGGGSKARGGGGGSDYDSRRDPHVYKKIPRGGVRRREKSRSVFVQKAVTPEALAQTESRSLPSEQVFIAPLVSLIRLDITSVINQIPLQIVIPDPGMSFEQILTLFMLSEDDD